MIDDPTPTSLTSRMSRTARPTLRSIIDSLDGKPLVAPGVGTPFEARCAVLAGFETVYLSGYATAAWGHGKPDVGLIALAEVSQALASVAGAAGVPVICDADTGYGDLINVAHTVRTLERAGAHAIQIEDQTWPKRCGHLRGKTVVPADEHVRKIAAAVRARTNPETMIIARTDALAPHGLVDALDRLKRCADAGADVLFMDAPTSIDELETTARELRGNRLVANMSESGLTPHLSAAEFYELGYEIVLFPTSALRLAASLITDFFGDLRRTGDSRPWAERMSSLADVNEIVGLSDLERWENDALEEVGT